MARYGARLVDAGYPILPIIPGQKAPGEFKRGSWQGYVGWQKHCTRHTKPFELSIWTKWPDAGIGIACGQIIALDIDVMDAEAVAKIETLARARLGDTQAVRIGQLPKRLLVYRAEKPFAGIKRHPLEILGRGQQFVGYADHPDTGKPYQWPFESLIDLPLSALPSISEQQAHKFLDEAFELVPPELRRKTLGQPRSAEHFYGAGSDLRGTVEGVAAALEWIPNDNLDYDSWIDIGLAIKAAIGEDGLPLWVAWSRQSPRSGTSGCDNTPERKWKTFNPNRIGAGTIYRHAMDRGWFPTQGMVINGAEADRLAQDVKQGNPGAELIAKAHAKMNGHAELKPEPQLEKPTAPNMDFVDQAPGLLGDMVRWMTRTAVSPQPFLALGASLCALGALAGHKYRFDTPDTRSNIYVIGLAGSGAGKEWPRKCIRRAFREAGLENHLGGDQIKSGSGLMTAVTEQPRILYQIDEFGHFIKAALDRKRSGYHLQEIVTNLTTLWTSSTDVVPGADYANTKERPRKNIHEPCVCLFGCTVPSSFWAAMQSGNVADGSLARYLVFLSPEDYPDEQDPASPTDGLEPIVTSMSAIAAGRPLEGNLASAGVICPHVVPLSDEALKADRALRDEHLAMKRKYQGTDYSAIVARFREHVRHVALIAAVGDNPANPICTEAHIAWAATLVRHCQETVFSQVERYIADTEYEAQQKKVLEIIRRHGGWMSGNDLAQKIRFIGSQDRTKILGHLAEAGLIEAKQQSTAGRPTMMVRAK